MHDEAETAFLDTNVGPGDRVFDVLTDEALIVPAGDPGALRDAIELLLRDDDLRAAYAERGRRYAEPLGGVAGMDVERASPSPNSESAAPVSVFPKQHASPGSSPGLVVRFDLD